MFRRTPTGHRRHRRGGNSIGSVVVDGPSTGRIDFNLPESEPGDSVVVEPGASAGFGDGDHSLPISVAGTGTEPTGVGE